VKASEPREYHGVKWHEPIIFELSCPGERGIILPEVEQEIADVVGDIDQLLPRRLKRRQSPSLPEVSEPRVLKHYLRLSQETMGNDTNNSIGLGTCTMKYNPKIHEQLVRNPKLAELHPYQDERTIQGILKIIHELNRFLTGISGMDHYSFQPSGGTQAIYANASVIRAYHEHQGEGETRDEVITTIFSHPGNAGAPSTAGYKVLTLMPDEKGFPDLEMLKSMVSERTAALFITNPEDTGIFSPNIKDYVDEVHRVGGLCVYDQANANGLLGITRAREAGFDLSHFNLHKTFASPHGSMGPGCGAQGVVEKLKPFLPGPLVDFDGEKYFHNGNKPLSIGKVRKFYGNVPVILRSYAYIMTMGEEGLRDVSEISILNNNYMLKGMREIPGCTVPYSEGDHKLEQVRYSWEDLFKETGVGTEAINRRTVDYGMQNYFESHHPWIVPEPFTPEPAETYSKEDIDEYVAVLRTIAEEARINPDLVNNAPHRVAIAKITDTSPMTDVDKFAVTWRAFKRKQAVPQ